MDLVGHDSLVYVIGEAEPYHLVHGCVGSR